jgi:tight adherence protein C
MNFSSYLSSISNETIAIFAFATVLVIFAAIALIVKQRSTQKALKSKVSSSQPMFIDNTEEQGSKQGWKKLFSVLGESTKPRSEKDLSHTRQMLVRAGYRSPDAAILYFGIKLFSAMALPVGLTFLNFPAVQLMPASQVMALFVFFAVVGFYAPLMWVKYKTSQRQEQILLGFPDAMDLMVVCVESGLGLDAAINRTAQEMQFSHPMMSEEFKLVESGLRAGQSRQDALRNLGIRTGLEDINNFTALLIQTDKFGTNIAQALRVHADSMRTKRRQRAEEAAAKVPVKLMFPLICFILPAMGVVVVGPGVIQVIRHLLPALGGN